MMMRKLFLIFGLMLLCGAAWGQVDRKEIRSGNRRFGKGDFRAAAVEYMRALDKDSTSFAGNYNLANVHYRLGAFDSAAEALSKLKDAADGSEYGADYYFNLGDVAIAKKDWQGAVDAFRKCLLIEPGSIEAKENYIYAKKHLENNQNGGGGEGQDNQQQDNQDDNQQQDNKQDDNDSQDKPQDGQQGQEPQPRPVPAEVKVSPQQAQQMLQAIQEKEKKTQDKVEKAKAAVGERNNEKNW